MMNAQIIEEQAAMVMLGTDAPKSVQITVVIPDDEALVGDYTLTISAESTNYN